MEIEHDLHSKSAMVALYIRCFGEEECAPAHFYGPARRDYYLIHFVASGCGTLRCGGRQWNISAGQGFLILPEEETFYCADEHTPWHYAWVGYCGTQADAITRSAGLDANHRVFDASDASAVWQALSAMREESTRLRLNQMAAAGNLLRFIALIAPPHNADLTVTRSQEYCEKALWYLESRYERDISIQETADFVGLSRSHLYRLMKEECGCSPKEALLQIRMRRARQLLTQTSLTLDEIARLIGLQTGTQLGSVFRSLYGRTPGQYRKHPD